MKNDMYGGLIVLAVALRKGGVGKTLFSILLAQYFSEITDKPKRVLVLDMDTQQNASECLMEMESNPEVADHKLIPVHPAYDPDDPDFDEWDGRSSTADIFLGDPGETLFAPYSTVFDNIDILPAHGAALLAVELVRKDEVKELIHDRFKMFLEDPDVQDQYDLIIIDTPPGKGVINQSVLRHATHVIYPVIPEVKPIAGLRGMIQFERMERRHRSTPINIVGVVPNKVNMQTNLHRENMEKLKSDPVIGPLLSDFYVGNRIAFPTTDQPGVKPQTIWDLSKYQEAKVDATKLGRFVELNIYGD